MIGSGSASLPLIKAERQMVGAAQLYDERLKHRLLVVGRITQEPGSQLPKGSCYGKRAGVGGLGKGYAGHHRFP